MYSNSFVFILFLDDMILHTSPNNVPPFGMQNGHLKLSICQLILLICIYLPPQVMNLLLIVTILSNIPPMLLNTVFHYDILLIIQVLISLF